MAERTLQFLDVPRAEPAKLAVETRIGESREVYAPFEPAAAAQQGCIASAFATWDEVRRLSYPRLASKSWRV